MVRARVISIGVAAGIAACFSTPPAPFQLDASPQDGLSDTNADSVLECTARDDFDATELGCGAWGIANLVGAVDITHNTGVLRMVGSGSAGMASCSARKLIDFSAPVTVQITKFVPLVTSYTTLTVIDDATGGSVSVRIEGQGTSTSSGIATLQSSSDGTLTQKPALPTTPWWRLSRVSGGSAILAENSPDGSTWTTFGSASATGATFATATVRLSASFPNSGSAYEAAFDNLNACP